MARKPVEAVPEPAGRLPVWRPIRGGNAFEITVARLAQAIRLGAVGVGERLPPERELADQLQVSRNLDHSDAQHDRIVDAILHGDPPAARAAMREHCDGTAELLRGLLG